MYLQMTNLRQNMELVASMPAEQLLKEVLEIHTHEHQHL